MQDPYAEFGGSVQTDAPPPEPPPGPSDGQRPVPTVLPVSGRISYDDPSGAGQVILPANANFNTFFKQSASGDQQAPPADPYAEFGGSIAPPVQGAGERFVRGVNAVMGGAEDPSQLLDSLKTQGEQIVKNPWMLSDPVGAYPMLKGMYDSMQQVGKQADQEWAAGNWDTAHGLMSKLNATIHYVESGVPMIGPIMADMDKHASEGDYAGALGRLTGLAATLGVEHAPAAIDATGRAVKATGEAVKNAVPYVATQAARGGAATFNAMKVPAATWFGGEHMGGLGALALGKAAERIPDIPVMEKPVWGGRPAPEPFRVPTPSGEPPPVGEGPPTVGTPSPPTQPEIKYGPTAGKRTIYPSAAGEAEAPPAPAEAAPAITDDSIAKSVFGLKNAAAAQEKFGADGWQERLSNIRASLEKEAAKPTTPTAESPNAKTPPVAEAIPPVVYRGTPRDTEFSPSMATSNSGYNSFGRGTYFSEDAGVAKDYAKGSSGTVIPSTLSLKQPFTVDWSTPEGAATTRAAAESAGIKLSGAGTFADPEAATAALKNKGYDGVIVKHEGHPAEFVAFDPASFQAAPEAAPEAPAKTEPPATPAAAIAEKQQAVHDAIDQVVKDPNVNKRVKSQVDFALNKGDLEAAQAAIDRGRTDLTPAPAEHAPFGGAEPAPRDPEVVRLIHKSIEDDDLLQQLRADMAHEESGVQLEKDRATLAGTMGEKGTKQMIEQAVKAPEERWTKMPNWSQRDQERVANFRTLADRFVATNVPAELPEGFGANNKLVTQERFEAAKRKYDAAIDKMNKEGYHAGADPRPALRLAIEMGGYYLEGGLRDFTSWAGAMLRMGGDVVRPYLRDIYAGLVGSPIRGVDEAATKGGLAPEMRVVAPVDPAELPGSGLAGNPATYRPPVGSEVIGKTAPLSKASRASAPVEGVVQSEAVKPAPIISANRAGNREYAIDGQKGVTLSVASHTDPIREGIGKLRTADLELRTDADAVRGKGYATRLYSQAMLDAARDGYSWSSDTIRSDATNQMYERLKEFGVPVQEDEDGYFITNADLKKSAPTLRSLATGKQIGKWFEDSKVVDENGEPLGVYHGTDKKFAKFRGDRPVWFYTKDSPYAEEYSNPSTNPIQVSAHLSIKNPFEANNYDDVFENPYDPDFVKELKAKGYDGIHSPDYGMWVAFDTDQIKRLDQTVKQGAKAPKQLVTSIKH